MVVLFVSVVVSMVVVVVVVVMVMAAVVVVVVVVAAAGGCGGRWRAHLAIKASMGTSPVRSTSRSENQPRAVAGCMPSTSHPATTSASERVPDPSVSMALNFSTASICGWADAGGVEGGGRRVRTGGGRYNGGPGR